MATKEPTQESRKKGWKIKPQKKASSEAPGPKENALNATSSSGETGKKLAPITSQMLETVRTFFNETRNTPVRITAVMDAEDGWDIEVELVEEQAYTQRYGRDQLIGIYEATMNNNQTITSYQRKHTRARSVPFEKIKGKKR